MKKTWKIGLLVGALVLALGTGVGIAVAKTAGTGQTIQAGYYAANNSTEDYANQNVNQWYCGGRGPMMGYLTPQVASLLGLTQSDLQNQLASGKTLAELAAAKNVSQDLLTQAMLGPYTDHLAVMVKYGYLTQAQADSYAQQAKIRLQTVITSRIGTSGGFGGMMRGWFDGDQSQTAPPSGYYGPGMMGGGFGGMMGRR
jgi:hypothetical protein